MVEAGARRGEPHGRGGRIVVGKRSTSPWSQEVANMMPGVQFEEIWKALYTGYSKKSLEQMLKFRLNLDLDDIVGDGQMRDMVFDLLSQSEREGWTTDLVREGYLYNPRNADLLKIYEKYGLAPGISAQQAGAAVSGVRSVVEGLEKAIR